MNIIARQSIIFLFRRATPDEWTDSVFWARTLTRLLITASYDGSFSEPLGRYADGGSGVPVKRFWAERQ